MKKLLIVSIALFATACASTSDLELLQSRVDVLETKTTQALTDANQSRVFSTLAAEKASAAQTAAEKALKICQDVNSKLDRLFKKAQFK